MRRWQAVSIVIWSPAMFGIGGFALLAAVTFGAQPNQIVPQPELDRFCQMYGTGHHLATFFLHGGVRFQGHVNCDKITFTLSQVLPPIGEESVSAS
jgi:hypothetical protein